MLFGVVDAVAVSSDCCFSAFFCPRFLPAVVFVLEAVTGVTDSTIVVITVGARIGVDVCEASDADVDGIADVVGTSGGKFGGGIGGRSFIRIFIGGRDAGGSSVCIFSPGSDDSGAGVGATSVDDVPSPSPKQ